MYTNIRADAAAAASLLAHQTRGSFLLSTNPGNTKTLTLTINGSPVVFTFVSSIGTTPGNVLIGASAAATCANLLALLTQPQTTTATGVAFTSASWSLLSYLSFLLVGTTLIVSDNNTTGYAPLTSFSASTNATSDSWTGNTLALCVEPGVVYVNGTRVIFAGGLTPTVTAPSANPRIDVLTIDSAGTLAWTTGAENASPVAPTYPSNKAAICELYNVTSETVLVDNANQASGKGYILNDVRPFAQYPQTWTAFTSNLIPDADGTRDLGSASKEWNNIYAKSGIFLNGAAINSQVLTALTAAEAISAAGIPLAAGYYQSDGGIKLDNVVHGHASVTSLSAGITVASNSNRILIVVISAQASISSVQYNGSGLTQIDSGSSNGYQFYIGYILAPTTGAHNVTATIGSAANPTSYAIYSYYNVAQTGTIDQHVTAIDTSEPATLTSNITPGFIGALVLSYVTGAYNSGSYTYSTSAPNNQVTENNNPNLVTGDNGQAANLTQQTITFTRSGSSGGNPNGFYGAVSLKPATTATLGQAINASSANVSSYTTPTSLAIRSLAFIGFSVASASATGAIQVITAGVVAGLTGLTPFADYYLADSPGTISTTPGTISRKVGIAISTTQLLVTNVW